LKLLQLIPNTFTPTDLFGEVETLEASSSTYYFRGFIVFCGNHYYAYFRDLDADSPSNCWVKYNDCQITRLGSWEDVIHAVCNVREQPVLLLYEIESYHRGLDRHYLNELIGEKQWKDLFAWAEEKDRGRPGRRMPDIDQTDIPRQVVDNSQDEEEMLRLVARLEEEEEAKMLAYEIEQFRLMEEAEANREI
jgi:hypothetical protein